MKGYPFENRYQTCRRNTYGHLENQKILLYCNRRPQVNYACAQRLYKSLRFSNEDGLLTFVMTIKTSHEEN